MDGEIEGEQVEGDSERESGGQNEMEKEGDEERGRQK